MISFTAQQISDLIGGSITGNAATSVHMVAKIEEANTGELSFVANKKYLPFAYTTKASILIVSQHIQFKQTLPSQLTCIRVPDAHASFMQLLSYYQKITRQKVGIEQPSYISEHATLGKALYVGAFAYIGQGASVGDNTQIYAHAYIGDNVQVGNNCIIYAGAKIYHNCKIGDNCIIHAGAVIGADGFGFAPQPDGTFQKIPQIGNVVIHNNVEVGANTTIDRATMGSTVIKQGVKLDNLIQVAHNVFIDENTVIAAQTGISGSTKIGKNCMIGGQTGFVGHITVADGNKFGAQSGVSKSIKQSNKSWNSTPAFDYRASLKSQVLFKKLPTIYQRLVALEKAIKGH